MFHGILHATLSKEKVSTNGVIEGIFELLLPTICPYSHQIQKQQIQYDVILVWPHVLIFLKENSYTG